MVGLSSLNFGFSMESFPKRVLLWPEALCRVALQVSADHEKRHGPRVSERQTLRAEFFGSNRIAAWFMRDRLGPPTERCSYYFPGATSSVGYGAIGYGICDGALDALAPVRMSCFPGEAREGTWKDMTQKKHKPVVVHMDVRKLKPEPETNLPSVSKARLEKLIAEAVVDAYAEDEQAVGLLTMIQEHLVLPFSVKILGVETEVEKVDMTRDGRIVAVCRRDNIRQRVGILDLSLPMPAPTGAEWIAAYGHWRRTQPEVSRSRAPFWRVSKARLISPISLAWLR